MDNNVKIMEFLLKNRRRELMKSVNVEETYKNNIQDYVE